MPEAVNIFFTTHDVNRVRSVQTQILESIRDDFGRYVDKNGAQKVNEVLKLRAEACLMSLPSQLAKEYKKFQYSLVKAKGHSTEKADGLTYLEDVGLVYRAYNIREISVPLAAQKINSEYKAYLADTGLLISLLDIGTAAKVLEGDISSYKGAMAENMVAAAMMTNGVPLYYYHAPSGSPELDFICSAEGEAAIIECKATNNRATSMKYVLSNPKKYGKHKGIKIADTNIGDGGAFTTYPLYAASFLFREKESFVVDIPDAEELNAMI